MGKAEARVGSSLCFLTTVCSASVAGASASAVDHGVAASIRSVIASQTPILKKKKDPYGGGLSRSVVEKGREVVGFSLGGSTDLLASNN